MKREVLLESEGHLGQDAKIVDILRAASSPPFCSCALPPTRGLGSGILA